MRHQLAPAGAIALVPGVDLEQTEVGRLPVAADDPATVEVLDRVLVAALAGQEDAELECRVRRVGVADFARFRALGHDQKEAAVLGVGDAGVEAQVVLLVDEWIACRIGAENVPPHPVAEQRHGILLDVEDARAVGVPGEVGLDVRDRVRQRLARGEVLEAHRVLPPPDGVVDVGQQPVVGCYGVLADRVVAVAPCELAGIQHHLLGRLERAGLARVDRVLAAGFVARVIPVVALPVRDGRIVLLDARDGLLVHAVRQRTRVRGHGGHVGVFRLEVSEHRLVGAGVVPQPVVLVHAVAIGREDRERSSLGDGGRWCGWRRGGRVRRLRRAGDAAHEHGHRQDEKAHPHRSAMHRSTPVGHRGAAASLSGNPKASASLRRDTLTGRRSTSESCPVRAATSQSA